MSDDGNPIYVFLISNPPDYPEYLELTVQGIKYIKRHIKNAHIGIITPPGSEDVTSIVANRLKEINPRADVENIFWQEGHNHFDNWDNTQRILDALSFAEEFDPIIFLDSDSVLIEDVTPAVAEFMGSGKKFGFINSYVTEYPGFDKNWRGRKFIPASSFQLYRASGLADLVPIWKDQWKTWIEPAPFVQNKDPARYYKNTKITIGQYSLAKALGELGDFDAIVYEIPRHSLKVARNLGLEAQKNKRRFLGAGSSYSNDGPIKVTINVKSAKVNEPVDASVGVNVGGWERKTKIVKGTEDPVWDQEFVFEDSSYNAANDILLTLYNNPPPPATRSFGGPYTGPAQVSIDVVSGTVTNKHDVVGEDDPYVKIKIGAVEKETKPRMNTNTPQWNENLTFDDVVSDDAQEITITLWDWDKFTKHDLIGTATLNLLPYNGSKQHVSITVLDKNAEEEKVEGTIELDVLLTPAQPEPVSTRDFDPAAAAAAREAIGTAKLSLLDKKTTSETDGSPGLVPFSLPVVDADGAEKGTLEIEGEFFVQIWPYGEEPPKTRSFAAPTVGGPYSGEADVTLNIVSGVIHHKHDVVGEDDPYVKVTIGGVEKETRHLESTNAPQWNEVLTFNNVVSADAQQITITVWDWDRFTKHDLVGTATLDLLPYNGNQQRVTVSLADKGVEEATLEIVALVTPQK